MAAHISFRDIVFTDETPHVVIVVTTDVPCHLWCRLTSEHPRVHLNSVLRRGEPFMSELRFCFVAYEDNEQTEAGDTLEHTWRKPAWGYCITKWCYFWGYVAGVVSPSTSPFFKHHNTSTIYVPTWTLMFEEPWTGEVPGELVMEQVFFEPWGTLELYWQQIFLEPWTI